MQSKVGQCPFLDRARTPAEARVDLPMSNEGALSKVSRRPSDEQSTRSVDHVPDGSGSLPGTEEESADEDNANDSVLAALVPKPEDLDPLPSISEPCVTKLHVYAAPPKADGIPDPDKHSSLRDVWRLPKSLGAGSDVSGSMQAKRASQSSLVKLRCTLDPALSEFASLFSSLDHLAKNSIPQSEENAPTVSNEHGSSQQDNEEAVEDYGYPRRLGRRPSLHLFNVIAAESNAQKRRHRRNVAALRINTAGLKDSEKHRQGLPPPKEEVTILSPKPISPARQLRVKNSIPQLMKALPPLPGEAANASGREGLDAPRRPAPCAPKRLCLTEEAFRDGCGLPEKVSASHMPEALQASPPNVKVLNGRATSPSGIAGVEGQPKGSEKERLGVLQHKVSQGARPRLKLKLSRNRLGRTRPRADERMPQASRLKQCNSLADMAVRSQMDAVTNESLPRDGARNRSMSAASDGDSASRAWKRMWTGRSLRLSCRTSSTYPTRCLRKRRMSSADQACRRTR